MFSNEIRQELLDRIDSDEPQQKNAAWLELQQFYMGQLAGDPKALLERLSDETAEATWKRGVFAVLCALATTTSQLCSKGTQRPVSDTDRPHDFADWFWQPLRNDSRVLRAYDPSRRRDDDAVIELARHLSHREFPSAKFYRINPDETDLQAALRSDPEALCLVGRLENYGEKAFEAIDFRGKRRFFFPDRERPADLPFGRIDPKGYHRIQQQESGEVIREFRTEITSEMGKRKDFGLVQRYYEHERMVIHLAGCGTLGTLGAVWAATSLAREAIPIPREIEKEELIEVLIEVQADESEFPSPWHPDDREILRIFVGNREWFREEQAWGGPQPDLLYLDYTHGTDRPCIRSNVRHGHVLYRGVPARLIEAIHKHAPKERTSVDEQVLREEPFWNSVEPVHYTRLQEKLHGAITIAKDRTEFTLNVPVRVLGKDAHSAT